MIFITELDLFFTFYEVIFNEICKSKRKEFLGRIFPLSFLAGHFHWRSDKHTSRSLTWTSLRMHYIVVTFLQGVRLKQQQHPQQQQHHQQQQQQQQLRQQRRV